MSRGETADRMMKSGAKTFATRPPRIEPRPQEHPVSGSGPSSVPSEERAPVSERPRSALKIRLDILEILRDKGPSRPTMILTAANLSHYRLVKYLGELVSQGLLNETKDSVAKSYALTAKGLDFVNQVKEAEAFVSALGLAL